MKEEKGIAMTKSSGACRVGKTERKRRNQAAESGCNSSERAGEREENMFAPERERSGELGCLSWRDWRGRRRDSLSLELGIEILGHLCQKKQRKKQKEAKSEMRKIRTP